MKRITGLVLLSLALIGLGCDERTEQTDTGGVLLELDFANLIPFRASVNQAVAGGSVVSADSLVFNSVVADPLASTSDLMDIELESIEVTFERVDGGTRVPPPYVHKLIGTIPVDGTFTVQNMPLMSFDQLSTPPLSDLLFENGGFDKETGLTFVRMNLFIRAFGRTLGNRRVESVPRPHTMEFTQ